MVWAQKLKFTIQRPFDRVVAERPNPILLIGSGYVEKIPKAMDSLGVEKLFIITDKNILNLGLLQGLTNALDQFGMGWQVFDAITSDPTYQEVEVGLQAFTASRCNGIMAFGGGSVIDATKAIVGAYDSQKSPQSLQGLLRVKERVTPFLVVPTTAGTGSETTVVAVISNTQTHKKELIISPEIIPDLVVLDAHNTVNLPKDITAATAADALTHALEAYVSRYATRKSSNYAETAMRLIFENLELVLEQPHNVEARETLLVGSLYGGMAFTRAYVGYVHAFAHSIGGKFGVSHGLANAVILPHIMRFYLPLCERQFATLAGVIKLPVQGLSQKEQAQAFLQALEQLLDNAGIPRRLKQFPAEAVPEIVKMAFKECHATYPVPKYLKKHQAEAILYNCCKA